MGRHSCCYKQKLRKGLWSPEEDEKLLSYITEYGHGCWSSVPKQAGLQRCGKSCRLRWINYLRPDLKRGTFSQEEEKRIIELHALLGNRWSQIAAQLHGRTDNEIKNLWNSCLKKRLRERGIDPSTHKPLSEVNSQEKGMGTGTSNSNEVMNLLILKDKVESSEPPEKAFLEQQERTPPSIAAQIYPLQLVQLEGSNGASCSDSNDNSSAPPPPPPPPNKEFLLDRHHQLQGHTACSYQQQPSDFWCYFPLNYASNASSRFSTEQNPTPPWFAHSGTTTTTTTTFDLNSINNNAISSSVLAPVTSSILPNPTPTTFKPFPSTNSSSSMGSQYHCMSSTGSRYWEAAGGAELQSISTSLFENNSSSSMQLSWGLGEYCSSSTSNKEAQQQQQQLEGEADQLDILKWSELYPLHNPFSTSQNQTSQLLYNQIKSEMHSINDGSSTIALWPNYNLHQQQAASGMCAAKDIHSFSPAFGFGQV